MKLRTLSAKSTEPKKGIMGVGDDGRNRAESVGKHEFDGSDDEHSSQCSERAHQQTYQLARPRLWLSMMGLDGDSYNGDFDVTFLVIR